MAKEIAKQPSDGNDAELLPVCLAAEDPTQLLQADVNAAAGEEEQKEHKPRQEPDLDFDPDAPSGFHQNIRDWRGVVNLEPVEIKTEKKKKGKPRKTQSVKSDMPGLGCRFCGRLLMRLDSCPCPGEVAGCYKFYTAGQNLANVLPFHPHPHYVPPSAGISIANTPLEDPVKVLPAGYRRFLDEVLPALDFGGKGKVQEGIQKYITLVGEVGPFVALDIGMNFDRAELLPDLVLDSLPVNMSLWDI